MKTLPAPLPAYGMENKHVGKFCVFDSKHRTVRCFQRLKIAKEVAQGFGPGFYAKRQQA